MEDSTKKSVMIVVIVVCLVAAAAVTYMSRSRGGGGTSSPLVSNTVWMKCTNPDCNAEYEVSWKEYQAKERSTPYTMMGSMAIRCDKCGKNSVYRAEKCEKCGLVFVKKPAPPGFTYVCPGCGYKKPEAAGEKGRGE